MHFAQNMILHSLVAMVAASAIPSGMVIHDQFETQDGVITELVNHWYLFLHLMYMPNSNSMQVP